MFCGSYYSGNYSGIFFMSLYTYITYMEFEVYFDAYALTKKLVSYIIATENLIIKLCV